MKFNFIINLFESFLHYYARALNFIKDRNNATQISSSGRETYSCFISFPVEIYRLTPFSVNLSLHVPFLLPEFNKKKSSISPWGYGLNLHENSSEYSAEHSSACGGVLELYESVLGIEEVSGMSIICSI